MKLVYLYDEQGYFTGYYWAHESPEEPGIYHKPTLSTPIEPPEFKHPNIAIFKDGVWTIKKIKQSWKIVRFLKHLLEMWKSV